MKLICLKLPVNVGTDAPDVRLILSLLLAVAPAVPPKLNVLVTDIAADIFDVPVNVKFVAVAIDRTVTAGVVVVNVIPPVPNAIDLVVDPVDEKRAVDSVLLNRSSVPLVSVVVLVAPTVIAS